MKMNLASRSLDAKLAKMFGWTNFSRIDDTIGFGSDLKGSINCATSPEGRPEFIPFYSLDLGALTKDLLRVIPASEKLRIEIEREASTLGPAFGVRLNSGSWFLADDPATALSVAVLAKFGNNSK